MKTASVRCHLYGCHSYTLFMQVVPTCTCPANRNVKDCCAGIMFALQQQTEFKGWFGKSFLDKKELLSHRLRADLDPVSALYTF